ncbi:MAG: hypothetical protein QOI47_2499, partial [Actinomycetota bacterium]|nr:hypothetical protein [Actinomycetota bacterium]
PAVQVARRGSAPVVISARLANAATPSTPAPATATGPARPAPGAHVAAAPAAASPPRPRVVALFGDSIADWLVRDAAPTFTRTDITLVDAAIEGCDGAVGIPPARGRLGQILPLPSDCKEWPVSYRAAVENPKLPVDVAVLVVGQAPILDREVAGRWVGPCTDMSWYSADIAARVAYLSPRVGDVVLAMPSWGGKLASYLAGADHVQRMTCIRTQLQGVATRLGLDVVDLADELCPAGPSTGCADSLRHNDGVHVDHEDAPAVLDWLLGRLPPRH